jgi:hypothetical protein
MRYKLRTPDAQAIRARYAEFVKDNPHREFLGPREPFVARQASIDDHYKRQAEQISKLGYMCGRFFRASDNYTNWPRRWYLMLWSTDHPPRVCRGQRKKRRRRA